MTLLKSRWIDSIIKISNNSQTEFLEELLSHSEFLFSLSGTFLWSSDSIMREFSKMEIPLNLKQHLLPVKNPKYFSMLGSKVGQFESLKDLQIQFPETFVLRNSNSTEAIKFDKKMIIKGDSHGGGAFIKTLDPGFMLDLESLAANWFPIVLQEYVDGILIGIEAYYKNGKLLFWLYSKVESEISTFGPSISRTYLFPSNLDFVPQLTRIGAATEINGFANISMVFDSQNQEHKIFEFDIRPNVWHHVFFDFKIPFGSIWREAEEFDTSLVFHVPKVVYEPSRLFLHYLSKWNLIGAIRVLRGLEIPTFGTGISSSFYEPELRSKMIGKLFLFPIGPFRGNILTILIIIKKIIPDFMKRRVDQSRIKSLILNILS